MAKTQSRLPHDAANLPADVQQHCIDLPGENVQCFIYKPNLEVVLRKHRDVIFDLKLNKGKTYKVYATDSDFYNARDKLIVLKKHKDQVTFKDGERLHLWVSRGFKGELVLESEGKIMMRVDPAHWDHAKYDDAPSTKPAPIIIAMNADGAPKQAAPVNTKLDTPQSQAKPLTTNTASAAHQQTDEQQDMHVIEINTKDKNIPQEVSDFFTHGGEETSIDTHKVLTRNWLLNLIVGTSGFYNDNSHWVNELWKEKFKLKKIVHKNAGAKYYVIFKGHAGLRKYLTASKYAVWNPKILSITSGAGSLKGTRHAAWSGIADTVKGGAKGSVLAIFFTMTIDVAEWLNDYLEIDPKTGKSKKDLLDLIVKIGIDIAKVFVAMALGAIAMAIAIFIATVVFSVTVAGWMVVVGSIVIGGLIGYKMELADQENGFSEKVNKYAHSTYDYLAEKLPKDYQEYSKAMDGLFRGVIQ